MLVHSTEIYVKPVSVARETCIIFPISTMFAESGGVSLENYKNRRFFREIMCGFEIVRTEEI